MSFRTARLRRTAQLVTVLAVAGSAPGCTELLVDLADLALATEDAYTSTAEFTIDDRTAQEALDALPIKGRAPKSGYDREELFGRAWIDVDLNGCDTRNDILARDLVQTTIDNDCRVLSGTLDDPFTGIRIDFVRGEHTSPAVQIDHVVALSDAWQKGAQRLPRETRVLLANDPLNLIAVDGPTNASKSDQDAASWLPERRSFRCEYVARQVSVKSEYELWVTRAEHDAMARVLAACPEQPAYRSALVD